MKFLSRAILGIGIFVLLPLVLLCSPVRAASFTRTVATTVTVGKDTSAQVTQVHTLSWDDSSQYFPASKNYIYAYITPAFSEQKDGIENSVKNITVKNQSGAILVFSKTIEDGSILLKIPYYRDLKKYQDLVFKISFNTSLYTSQEGGILEVYYPGLPRDFKSVQKNESGYTDVYEYSVSAVVPTSFGPVSASFPSTSAISKKNDNTTVTYTTSQLVGNAIRVIVGSERKIKFRLEGKSYATNTDSPNFVKDILVNYIDVALPSTRPNTEFSNQSVMYSKIEPFPIDMWTDEDGNVIARLPIPATQDGTILIEGYAVIRPVEVPETIKSVKITDIPAEMNKYTAEEPQYWQVTAVPIQEMATSEKDPGSNQYLTVRNSLLKVVKTLSYSEVVSEDDLTRQGALGALNSKHGVCMEYSDLLLSLLRAQKIPTRAVYGDGLGRRVDKTLEGIGHQWVGVWFPDVGWIPVEPTWSDKEYLQLGHDMDHFTWYVASKSVNIPLGFACKTLDSSFPCREAMRIHTESVDSFPEIDTLQSLDQIQRDVENNKVEMPPVKKALQSIITYLGTSRLGRVILSTKGLILTLALTVYLLLVGIISAVARVIRKRKKGIATTLPIESQTPSR